MKVFVLTIALLTPSFVLVCCDRSPAGGATSTSSPQPEVTVSNVADLQIKQTFHRGIDLGAFLKTQPSGSVDVLDTIDVRPYVIAVIEVRQTAPAAQTMPARTPRGFKTIFRGKGEAAVTKLWTSAAGNTSNAWRAVFVLPDSIETAETRLSSDP